jgi:hypothetical protein
MGNRRVGTIAMCWSKRLYLTLLSCALFAASPDVRAADEPVGMILLVRGEGRLLREGSPGALSLGDLLSVGDIIEIDRGGVTVAFCPTNLRLRIDAGSAVRVGAERLEVLNGPEPEIAGRGACVLPRVALGSESLERMGALRPRGRPPIPVFLGGRISTARPLFEWAPVEGADLYGITLRNEAGRVLWEIQTAQPRQEFPRDLSPLEPGWYSWELNAEANRTILAQQNTGFEVIENEGTEGEMPEKDEELLVRAFELEGGGYFAESASLLRTLESRGQESPRLTRRLAWLYWRAGLIPAFNREMERFGDADPD